MWDISAWSFQQQSCMYPVFDLLKLSPLLRQQVFPMTNTESRKFVVDSLVILPLVQIPTQRPVILTEVCRGFP